MAARQRDLVGFEKFLDRGISFAINILLGAVGGAGLILGGWVFLVRIGLGLGRHLSPGLAPPSWLLTVVPMPELAMLLGALLIGFARLITLIERQIEVAVDRGNRTP
jgi:hypothetical protein